MRRFAVALFALLSVHALAQTHVPDVIYLKQAGCAYTMDVFTPKTPNHKAIVWMVSGGWFSHHEDINPGFAKLLTDKGYTVFEVVHGSQPKYTIPEIVPMVRRAIRFVRSLAGTYDFSPNAIGVTGASAGGHLSLEIAGLGDDGDPNAKDPVDKLSSRVNAVVAFMPPTDFENWGTDGVTPIQVPNMKIYMPAFGVTDLTPKEVVQKVAHDVSPIILVKPGFPPTLIVHGAKDALVPLQQAKKIDAAFAAANVTHKLVVVPTGGHDLGTMMGGMTAAFDWFDTNLTVTKN